MQKSARNGWVLHLKAYIHPWISLSSMHYALFTSSYSNYWPPLFTQYVVIIMWAWSARGNVKIKDIKHITCNIIYVVVDAPNWYTHIKQASRVGGAMGGAWDSTTREGERVGSSQKHSLAERHWSKQLSHLPHSHCVVLSDGIFTCSWSKLENRWECPMPHLQWHHLKKSPRVMFYSSKLRYKLHIHIIIVMYIYSEKISLVRKIPILIFI